ncbi:MAG: ribonuclease III [Candidatus Riflebacteria bacterium]|nr:ribonuclease III [Candidatus Riflebacteria bacterium]
MRDTEQHVRASSEKEATWEQDLRRFEARLGVKFKNKEILKQALTHSSSHNGRSRGVAKDNERLEFLGDAVLELVISHLLFVRMEQSHEGQLTQLRSQLVNRTALAQLGKELNLPRYVKLGKGEASSGGAWKDSINCNAMEAVLGALYLDQSWDKVFRAIERLFHRLIGSRQGTTPAKDPKSLLQEVSLSRFGALPRYVVLGGGSRTRSSRSRWC